MESGETNIYERLFKLWASITKLIMSGNRSPYRIADMLQKIVDEKQRKLALYTHPKQNPSYDDSFTAFWEQLKKDGILELFPSHDDEMVREWIRHPHMYPNKFKKAEPLLWGSYGKQTDGKEDDGVAYLQWNENPREGEPHLEILWYSVDEWVYDHQALIEVK